MSLKDISSDPLAIVRIAAKEVERLEKENRSLRTELENMSASLMGTEWVVKDLRSKLDRTTEQGNAALQDTPKATIKEILDYVLYSCGVHESRLPEFERFLREHPGC